MKNYYYLVAGFPDIILDQKKIPFTLAELKEELKYHLQPNDYRLVEYLFLQYDNINFLNLLLKKEAEFIPLGNFDQNFLTDEIKEPEKLPAYLKKFLATYLEEDPIKPNLSLENQLTWFYYDFMLSQKNQFLRQWFTFLRDMNNIFAVYNARDFDLNIENQLIGSYDLTEAALRTTSKDFGLANELPYIDQIIGIHENTDIVEQEIAINLLQWKYLEELNTFNSFTVEKALEFVIKFIMMERWTKLETEQSREIFNKMLGELKNSVQFSKDFNINEKRR